jgi:hypothetical protein
MTSWCAIFLTTGRGPSRTNVEGLERPILPGLWRQEQILEEEGRKLGAAR